MLFKGILNKKESNASNITATKESSRNKNLQYEECKKLSDIYLMPCKVIYELHAEFNSLVLVANQSKNAVLMQN